jgi:hypothetical protein
LLHDFTELRLLGFVEIIVLFGDVFPIHSNEFLHLFYHLYCLYFVLTLDLRGFGVLGSNTVTGSNCQLYLRSVTYCCARQEHASWRNRGLYSARSTIPGRSTHLRTPSAWRAAEGARAARRPGARRRTSAAVAAAAAW